MSAVGARVDRRLLVRGFVVFEPLLWASRRSVQQGDVVKLADGRKLNEVNFGMNDRMENYGHARVDTQLSPFVYLSKCVRQQRNIRGCYQ